jgi:hypothetical protein
LLRHAVPDVPPAVTHLLKRACPARAMGDHASVTDTGRTVALCLY